MNRFPLHTFQQDAILARLSQALVALEVSNVKSLTSEQCEKLQCGDVVVKKDSSGEHSYVVTFKSDTGMCLTYMDASVIETQSYDKGESGWVYNSEDKTPNLLDAATKADIEGGTLSNAKPIYCHPINISYIADANNSFDVSIFIFDNNPEAYTWLTFKQWLDNLTSAIGTVRVLTTGNVMVSGVRYPANYLYSKSDAKQFIVIPLSSGVESVNLNLTSSWSTLYPRYFQDSVNKIN